jgi:MarR family 2-MHQ and catechol resistance regulon transcriptional repressor
MARTRLPSIDDERITAFGLFLEAFAGVSHQVERDLADDVTMPAGWLGVLIRLGRSPGNRMRMSDLASAVALTSSGVTRLVDRIEAAGLITREACPTDRRVAWATLTAKGRKALDAALPGHLSSIQRHLVDHLTAEQYETFVGALRTLRDASLGEPMFDGTCATREDGEDGEDGEEGDGEAAVAEARAVRG